MQAEIDRAEKLNNDEVTQFISLDEDELQGEFDEDEDEERKFQEDEFEEYEEFDNEGFMMGISLENDNNLLPRDRKPARKKTELEEIGDMFLDFAEESTLGSLYRFFDRLSQSLSLAEVELQNDERRSDPIMDNKQFQTRMADIMALPDINKIEVKDYDESVLKKKVKEYGEDEQTLTDVGVFVNPLTGDVMSSSSTHIEEENVSEEISIEADEISIYREDSELLEFVENRYEIDQELFKKPSAEEIDDTEGQQVEQFFEDIKNQPVEEIPAERLSEIQRLEKQREKNAKLISEFLQHLILRAVQMVENVDRNVVLRKNLDKNKMALAMIDILNQTKLEQRISQILTRKTSDYFRRKNALRYLHEDPHTIRTDKIKYYENLEHLDTMLGYKKHTIENKEMIEEKLQQKYDELYDICMTELESFEALVRSTFLRTNTSEKYQNAIQHLLRRMNRTHVEVDNERRELIFKQSCVSHLNSVS